jgi:hypothetical protein
MSPTSVKSFDRNVPAWMPLTRGDGGCTGPDNNDWCKRGQSKIRGAFMTNDVVAFLWDANKGGTTINNATFTYPYVDAATFNIKNDMTYVGRPYLWSPDFAWMYGFAAPDNNGNVAMQAVYGGGDYHPSIAAGVANNFSADSFPWKVIQVVNGTNGPSADRWGDYITIRPINGEGPGWIGSGWTLYGGTENENVLPRYFKFELENKNNTSTTEVVSSITSVREKEYENISFNKFF